MNSRVHPKYKTKYRVSNWPEYERGLVQRGNVTIWLSPEAVASWKPARDGRRGGQRKYSDLAIETALTLRLVFRLPLRQAEALVHGSTRAYPQGCQRPMAPGAGLPSSNILFSTLHASVASTAWASDPRARSRPPSIAL